MIEHTFIGLRERNVQRILNPVRWAGALMKDVRQISRERFVLYNLVSTQLKVRYQRSVLGFFWTLLNPLMMLTVLAIVFSQVMRWNIGDYSVYLFAGLVPWGLASQGIEAGTRTLVANEGLIRKVSIHKLIFPMADVIVATINMFFAMIALFIILAVVVFFLPTDFRLHQTLVLLPIATVLLALVTLGVALITMTMNTFFRDVDHITSVVLTAVFYASPILYKLELLKTDTKDLTWIAMWNPMTHFIELFHSAIYSGVWPTALNWIVALSVTVGTLVVGYVLFKLAEHRYIFRL